MKHLMVIGILVMTLCVGLNACAHHGDMHSAGEHMENAGHEMGEAAKDTAHSAGHAIEKAGEKIEEKTD